MNKLINGNDKVNIGFRTTPDFYKASNSDVFAIKNKTSFALSIFVEAQDDVDFWKSIFSHTLRKYPNIKPVFIPASDLITEENTSANGCSRLYSLLHKQSISLSNQTIICVDSDHSCYSLDLSPYENWCKKSQKDYNADLDKYIFYTITYSIENIQYDFLTIEKLYFLDIDSVNTVKEYLLFLDKSKPFLNSTNNKDYYAWLDTSTNWLKEKQWSLPDYQISSMPQNPDLKATHLIRGHNLAAVLKKILRELQSNQCGHHFKEIQRTKADVDLKTQTIADFLPKIEESLNIILGSNSELIENLPIKKTIDKFSNFLSSKITPSKP